MNGSILCAEVEHEVYFGKFISKLSEKFQPLQIFCFYKISSLEKKQGCFRSERNSFSCDYGLLLVTATATRIDYEVQDYANSNFTGGMITVICHSNESVWNAIKSNSRFFKAVYGSGDLLYSHDGLLIKPYVIPYNPISASLKALKHFHHRLPLAEGFLTGSAQCLAAESYSISVFMLHQAVEQACILLIRVHIAYRSEFHNLNRLLGLCQSFSSAPYKTFFETAESRRLSAILFNSYSGARYKSDFSVSRQDAESLFILVESFMSVTKSMCNKKIGLLEEQKAFFTESQTTGETEPRFQA